MLYKILKEVEIEWFRLVLGRMIFCHGIEGKEGRLSVGMNCVRLSMV